MAMTLSQPHRARPYELPGTMLGDYQLARHREWEQAGVLADHTSVPTVIVAGAAIAAGLAAYTRQLMPAATEALS